MSFWISPTTGSRNSKGGSTMQSCSGAALFQTLPEMLILGMRTVEPLLRDQARKDY